MAMVKGVTTAGGVVVGVVVGFTSGEGQCCQMV
jgi:hypothetical protein